MKKKQEKSGKWEKKRKWGDNADDQGAIRACLNGELAKDLRSPVIWVSVRDFVKYPERKKEERDDDDKVENEFLIPCGYPGDGEEEKD